MEQPYWPVMLPNLFRSEYAKMTAVLCRHFGFHHIEIAEDIASETFLKASETWPVEGFPENPHAWLYTVAKNKARDYVKRINIYENKVTKNIPKEVDWEDANEINEGFFYDSQLAMIFAVCHPINPPENQICLALQILCGFSVNEIANAFLSNRETIKKRLYRARLNLRKEKIELTLVQQADITTRMDVVLRTLYLLFNEGYFSKTQNRVIRKELCSEAIRLGLLLIEKPLTATPETYALLALMCYQSSRLEARVNNKGGIVLFEEQDQLKWDQSLIEKANFFLVKGFNGNTLSKYHLEAGIAYWHTHPENPSQWKHILNLYNELLLLEYSPVVALNRTFAFAKVYGNSKGTEEAKKLNLKDDPHYHALLGYLAASESKYKSAQHYREAIKLTQSETEKLTLLKWLNQNQ